jgi:hypothetical protein
VTKPQSEEKKRLLLIMFLILELLRMTYTNHVCCPYTNSFQKVKHKSDIISPQLAAIGYNATILAYGQTGSGKTYTMGTDASGRNLSLVDSTGIMRKLLVSS